MNRVYIFAAASFGGAALTAVLLAVGQIAWPGVLWILAGALVVGLGVLGLQLLIGSWMKLLRSSVQEAVASVSAIERLAASAACLDQATRQAATSLSVLSTSCGELLDDMRGALDEVRRGFVVLSDRAAVSFEVSVQELLDQNRSGLEQLHETYSACAGEVQKTLATAGCAIEEVRTRFHETQDRMLAAFETGMRAVLDKTNDATPGSGHATEPRPGLVAARLPAVGDRERGLAAAAPQPRDAGDEPFSAYRRRL